MDKATWWYLYLNSMKALLLQQLKVIVLLTIILRLGWGQVMVERKVMTSAEFMTIRLVNVKFTSLVTSGVVLTYLLSNITQYYHFGIFKFNQSQTIWMNSLSAAAWNRPKATTRKQENNKVNKYLRTR